MIQASLFNARDLLDSARLLLANGRAGQAHALATLAFEEIGKSHICVLVLVPAPPELSPIPTPGKFWRALGRHEEKLKWARAIFTFLTHEPTRPVLEAIERLTDEVRADHMAKMRGLYVDYSDGSIQAPDSILRIDAELLIADVQVALDFSLAGWDHDQVLERLHEMQAHSAEIEQALVHVQAAIDVDPDAVMASMRDLIRSGQDVEVEPLPHRSET